MIQPFRLYTQVEIFQPLHSTHPHLVSPWAGGREDGDALGGGGGSRLLLSPGRGGVRKLDWVRGREGGGVREEFFSLLLPKDNNSKLTHSWIMSSSTAHRTILGRLLMIQKCLFKNSLKTHRWITFKLRTIQYYVLETREVTHAYTVYVHLKDSWMNNFAVHGPPQKVPL